MASSKIIKSKKLLLLLAISILLLAIAVYQAYRILQPDPVVAPIASALPKPDITGIYKGDLPCADCPGITETLILAKDGSYILEDIYQEKSVKPLQSMGRWEIEDANVLKLTPSDNPEPQYFLISDNSLQMLDSKMQKIDSPFNQTLTRQ